MTALGEEIRKGLMGQGQPLVKALMSQIVTTDENYPADGIPRERKNYFWRVK